MSNQPLKQDDFLPESPSPTHGSSLPTDHPMNWTPLFKTYTLLLITFNAFIAGFSSAILIPATIPLSTSLSITPHKATYLVSVHVLFLGLGSFLWVPLFSAYGRRPVAILAMFISLFANLGGGFATSYGTLMTARVIQSISVSCAYVIGSAVVVDIFTPRERGRKVGVWTLLITVGPAIAPLLGGPLVSRYNWPWALWLCAIINSVELLLYIFTFRETLYRPNVSKTALKRVPGSSLSLGTFLSPLLFLASPTIVICALTYGIGFGFTSVGMSVIVPDAFSRFYDFDTTQQGLVFIAVLVGVVIGEQAAGPVSDWVMSHPPNTPHPKFENRLKALFPGYVLIPSGMVVFGICLQNQTHWIFPCLGLGIAIGGAQILSTVFITYAVDCYSKGSGPLVVGQFVNIVRQIISFTVPFWSPVLSDKIGFARGFGVEAGIAGGFFVLSLVVFWRGEEMRRRWDGRWLAKFGGETGT